MTDSVKKMIRKFGLPRIIIVLFFCFWWYVQGHSR